MTEVGTFLSTLPPARGERRLALAVVTISFLAFLVAALFAKLPLAPVTAFIPAYEAALVINDLITAVLLVGQAAILRSRALLALACGYLFTALMVVPHALTFPGLFSPTGLLGAGPQSTAWLYMGWHAGFPLLVIAYAVLKRRDREDGPLAGTLWRTILGTVAAVAAVVCALAWLTTAGHDVLPAVMRGNNYTPAQTVVVTMIWAACLAALATLWFQRPRTSLDLWLMVVMCAWLFDVALGAVLNGGRYDLGFYAGRIYGLLAASFVLVALLLQTFALYARLIRDLVTERAESERRAQVLDASNTALRRSEEQLRQLNETLEQCVQERSRQLEAEIAARERAQDALREVQKREAIGRLAGGIAHDFNNVLTVILGNAELLLGQGTGNGNRHAASAIERAAERGARLIRQILAFSRRQAEKPERIDLRQRATEMAELLDRALRGDIRVVVEMADDVWPIVCDLDELELSLMNLCVNARDAMPGGGVVRIGGRNVELSAAESLGTGLLGDFVALSVTDTGSGIAADDLPRVFEPFFSTKAVGRGTGLGLSQVQGFAQQSSGLVKIVSEVGRGTVVTIYLPRAGAAEALPAVEGVLARVQGRGLVLVVEDDEDVALVAMNMLTLLGYQSTHVRDARTALALLLGGQRFDLMFSDIVMPGGMSGLELARKARQHFPRLPVLLASGFHRAAAEVAREGFAIIAKPYRADALSDALRETLARAADRARRLA